MRKAIRLGLMLTFSISTLAGCGSIPTSVESTATATTTAFSVRADEATTDVSDVTTKGQGNKGGHSKGGFGNGFNLPAELNLTAEQKTALEALKPVKPEVDQTARETNKTAMEALQAEIKTAFISDTFDVASLKAKQEALKVTKSNVDRSTAEAERIVKTYNILTAEQRAILETKQAEMAAKTPQVRPTPPADQANSRIDKLATDLGLSAEQKTSLAAIIQPNTVDSATHDTDHAKRKATMDAVNAALKAGNATVESVAAILKANEPTDVKVKVNELDRLAQIHAVLNAEQRTKFIESNKGFGHGDKGGHKGPGGRGK